MADENIEETLENQDIDLDTPDENKVEKRIKGLSQKVKDTSDERDKLVIERDSAKKEVEFYSSFSNATDKYPLAKDFKDKIKEKVLAGYTVEDATVAVLASEGKLTPAPPATESPAGGSAVNQPSPGGPKSLEEMTREEKREEVLKAVERGEISV